MEFIKTLTEHYQEYLPYMFSIFVIVLLITPFVGFFNKITGIKEKELTARDFNDPSRKTRMKKHALIRGGGLAVIIPLIIFILLFVDLNRQVTGILISIILLGVVGALDDKFEINPKIQLLVQIMAVLITVASGISISSVQNPFGNSLDLEMFSIPFPFLQGDYAINIPADLITIAWLLMIMNAINWVYGVDGLGEGVSFISLFSIFLISIEAGSFIGAFLSGITAFGILGFIPYNLYPSKIISGSTGTFVFGFLIGALAILSGSKLSSAIIVLAIPVIDMVWVMVGRIQRHKITSIFKVFKVTMTGDDTHLHHRLLKLGLSVRQISFFESMAVGICAVIAFLSADLPKAASLTIIILLILSIFYFLYRLQKKGAKLKRTKKLPSQPETSLKKEEESPEKKYAY